MNMYEETHCPRCGKIYLRYVSCWQSSFCMCDMKVTLYMNGQEIGTYKPMRTKIPQAFYKAFEDHGEFDAE